MLNNGEKKIAYVPMVADYLHPGHLNILNAAAKLGYVVVGLYTDKAAASYKRVPFMSYEQRKVVLENLKIVDEVVEQDVRDYEPNLRKFKPHYLVHGTDWRNNALSSERERAIKVMAEWNGEVIEPEYTKNISSSEFHVDAKINGIMPSQRIGQLQKAIAHRPVVRIIEAHSGLSAMVADQARVSEPGQPVAEFDGLWLSSLTDSTLKGKPDIEFVDLTSRITTVNDILECTTKPIIYDGDTGGLTEHIHFTVRRLERLGVSAIIIEDKTGSKKNSLLHPSQVIHVQDSIENFSEKIKVARAARITSDFMVIARIESLITGMGMEDALTRARAFMDAGADGIMIHSRKSGGAEIFEFCEKYNQWRDRVPLVAVPTNYSSVYEEELIKARVNIIIYANQMLRSAYTAMTKACESILKHGRASEADEEYISSVDMIKLIEGN